MSMEGVVSWDENENGTIYFQSNSKLKWNPVLVLSIWFYENYTDYKVTVMEGVINWDGEEEVEYY